MARILVVDDEPSICWGLARLGRQMGHEVATASSAEEGLESARHDRPDVVVLDIRLPGIDGLTAMSRFRELVGAVPIIVITAYGELSTAVEAIRGGAFDYLTKPFELDAASRAIQRALRRPSPSPPEPSAELPGDEDRLIGRSPVMQEVFKRIALVAESDACVHLRGESGTGKELAARAIHRYGRRAGGPFVPIHVASLSPSLAESELFGHVRGAFTGADQSRKGLLEQADGGTVFLDEVADIPLGLQVKLLRALEHGEVLPVGANRPVRSDFRIVSATHRDLADRVAEGTFRHDLYFRLVTFEIVMPPLRQRGDDIGELAEYFLDRFAARSRCARPALPPETRRALAERPWHGNVRELRNAIEHAMILARGGAIQPEHLPPPMAPPPGATRSVEQGIASLVRRWADEQLAAGDVSDLYERLLALVEPPVLGAAMEHCNRQCAAAARRLGLHRTTLRNRLRRWNLAEGSDAD